MSTSSQPSPSSAARLFTIRLWQTAPEAALTLEWRGKVQSLSDGEAYYFRNWSGLIKHLEAILGSEHGPDRRSHTASAGRPRALLLRHRATGAGRNAGQRAVVCLRRSQPLHRLRRG